MTIDTIDSYSQIRDLLTAPLSGRPSLLEELLGPVAGMYRYFPGEVDLVAMHHMGSGFRVDRDDERALIALEALREANAWSRIDAALHEGLGRQLEATPGIRVPDIRVMIVVGDCADEHFMNVNLGMSANGGVSGFLWFNFWPSTENLARLEAVAAHELNHNLRYTNVLWDPATVTVGEQVVSEGLADAFARDIHGDLGYTRVGIASLNDDAAFEKVMAGLGVTGMQNFVAYVHGDATAIRFGASPVGLPTGAGYAVGNRLLDAYLAATSQTAADALLVDADEVVLVASAALQSSV